MIPPAMSKINAILTAPARIVRKNPKRSIPPVIPANKIAIQIAVVIIFVFKSLLILSPPF